MADAEQTKRIMAMIEKRVDASLSPLQREMDIMEWPDEFRSILWHAVAEEALHRAQKAKRNG